jgi:tRNA A37 threonylcarbamoyladenosine synthetase subunit TsaC/SUA5/YrdC
MNRVFSYTEHNIELLCSAVVNHYLPEEKKEDDTDDSNMPNDVLNHQPSSNTHRHAVEPLLIPSYTTYLAVAPISSSDLFHKWIQVTNRNAPTSLMIYHPTHIPTIAKLRREESEIITALTDKLWSEEGIDELSIMVPPNEDIHPVFRQPNGKVIIEYSNHPVLRRLQEFSHSPLAVQTVYSNGIPCSAYGHLEDAYRQKPVLILQQDEPCKRGVESTLIDICTDTKTIRIVRTGTVTPSEILEALEESDYSHYQVVTCYERASQYIKTVRPQWNKRVYRVNWASLDIFPEKPTEKAYKELVHNTHAYLDKCIFIDNGGMHPEFATVCWGYVDIDQFREVKQAIHTFYDILHQISHMDSSHPVLIFDAYNESGDANDIDEYLLILQERIRHIETDTNHVSMCIPYECICDILGRKSIHIPREITAEERAENMEMVD